MASKGEEGNGSARISSEILVIGSGIAGCTTALQLADKGCEVTLVCAGRNLDDGNTALAQGGIVYQGRDDRPDLLRNDIQVAGRSLNYRRAVQYLSKRGPEAVRELLVDRLKVPFEREEDNSFKLTREGGHGRNRILYCADYTGWAIMDRLKRAVRENPNINLLTRRTAVDLLTTHHHSQRLEYKYQLLNQCVGAYLFNQHTGQVEMALADYTVLATGGVGQVYLHTTNTPGSIGSGLTMAQRSGAKVLNCEYVQFHPTALFQRGGQQFLITEAIRGEGAKFIRMDGKPFMKEYDPRGDLAPRDVVTRAIVEEMLKTGDDFVYLDAASYVENDLPRRFPTIHRRCLELGMDMTRQAIPVVPAAHFFCGGILVDQQGRSTLHRLYAVGECTCTGVHGANRLASTSLLEGLLWGQSAAESIGAKIGKKNRLPGKLTGSIPHWTNPGTEDREDPALIAQDWATIKNTMWNYVGIVRTTSRLNRAYDDLYNLNKRLYEFYRHTPISRPLIQLFHGCQTANLITFFALRNLKSTGCHYRVDS